ncbi:hypothetical protein WN944_019718 [Citrus x changshan-huyou]|uniref:Uncharacterized protein n=1 Tax=Citrus x changshan-huyou TaxID=2935761 RepID=A0AAP0LVT6_9ROSI
MFYCRLLCTGLVIELHRLRLHQLCGDDRVAFNMRSSSFMREILASFVLPAEVEDVLLPSTLHWGKNPKMAVCLSVGCWMFLYGIGEAGPCDFYGTSCTCRLGLSDNC